MSATQSNKISIVIRALNEEKWLADAILSCKSQVVEDAEVEVVLVDSGSTDRTLEIAAAHNCVISHIKKSDFTFGRSLNQGCDAASGDILVFISAHCIPDGDAWLAKLIAPLQSGEADYVYGRQIGHELTKFSEHQVFAQYFPPHSKSAEENGFFANNANSALKRTTWKNNKFDEDVTGLEDMVLGRRLTAAGGKVVYVADAPVVHIHEETFSQIRRRYYREALTLREIMPQVHFHFSDFVRFFSVGVLNDFSAAASQRRFLHVAHQIVAFRLMQYWGTYRGHNEHRALSRAQKESYYYPRSRNKTSKNAAGSARSARQIEAAE